MNKLFHAFILLAVWLIFGGAYVLDVLDLSYEMKQMSAFEQAVEPDDEGKSKVAQTLRVVHGLDSVEFPVLQELFPRPSEPNALHTGLLLHQRLSVYRI